MMTFNFKITIGGTEFTIQEQCETHAQFFEKVSFFSQLPTKGPNGEDDLCLVHRTTKEGYNYYSIVSQQAKKEFKFGQVNNKPGELFPKGWEDLYEGNGQAQQVGNGAVQQGGLGTPVQQNVGAPVQQAPGIQQNVQPQNVQPPVQQQAAPQVPPQMQPQQANQNQQIANNVLQQFGIQN